ncbi:MAG: PAS domain-containing protein [Deltaproteobacteria bacterium]|nr:PAS domain-containing protein [Deltaproteobacteria bacterium]
MDPTSKDWLRAVINAVQEPIIVIDRSYQIVDANRAASAKTGPTAAALVGRTCHAVTHKSDVPCFEHGTACPVKTLFETGLPNTVVHRHPLPDGSNVLEEIRATPLFDEDGQVAYAVEHLRDVGELLQAKAVTEELRARVSTLEGILPTCAWCKKIRTAGGEWVQMERYVADRSEAEFSHGVCPPCAEQLRPKR